MWPPKQIVIANGTSILIKGQGQVTLNLNSLLKSLAVFENSA